MKIISRSILTILLIVSVVLPTSKAFADNIDAKKARQVAAYFMAAQFGNKAITGDNIKLVYEIPNIEKGIATLYAFNTADNRGFVIVSGNNCVEPIIAYSTDGSFDPDNIPPAMQWWLGEQANMIAYCQNEGSEAGDGVLNSWRTLEEQRLPYFGQDSKAITRLLNTKWNQNYPYNSMCPPVSNGTWSDIRGRAYVGCVATAMSQIIRYWEYPRKGMGSKTYHVSEPGIDTTLYVNFSQAYYDYENMPAQISGDSDEDQINAIAYLGYHCGVSVEMGYDGDGSGTPSEKVIDALGDHFKYVSDSIRAYNRKQVTFWNQNSATNPNRKDTAWVNIIVKEIMMNRPVYYAGMSPTGGRDARHAFVCDGWNTTTKTLHFNWGWGGSGDCWCNVYTAQLKPGAGTGESYNFTEDNRIIIGITPPQDSIHTNTESIIEVDNPFNGAIYPNPASTQISVNYTLNDNNPAMLQIFDAAGRMVKQTELSPVSTQILIPVSELNPGIYFCRINGYTKKFVVR